MHVIVVAAFAVSAALGQEAPAPAGPNQPTAPPVVDAPPPSMMPPAAAPPAPLDMAPVENQTKASLLASEGDGRWGMITVGTVLGFTGYGLLVPVAFGLTDSAAIGGYLLTAAAGFFLPFGLTLNTPVTWGMTNMFYGGATHGPGHAALFMTLLNVPFNTGQQFALTALGFGIAETAAAMFWANSVNMTAGTAHAIIVGSDIAAAWLGGISVIIVSSNTSTPVQVPAALALVGAAGGATAGAVFGPMLHMTWGDAELFQASTALGAFVPVPFVFWGSPSGQLPDIRVLTGAALVGAIGGGAAGYFLLQQGHLELGQALLVDLGTVAGGLVGLGTALLFNPFNNPNGGNITLTTVMVGAVGGYAISYLAMKSTSAPKRLASSTQVQLTVNPLAFTDAFAPKTPEGKPIKLADRTPPALALVGTF